MKIQKDLTVNEALHTLNCARSTLYKLIKDGKLAVYKLGRTTRIRRDSLEALRGGQS